MALFYVTGVAGTGKTTVCHALRARGFVAYDSDEDNISACVDKAGKPAPMPEDPKDLLSTCPDGYAYQFVPERILALIEKSKHETIFLCGAAANDNDYWESFTKVFALTIDMDTLITRLQNRIGNNYGKNPRDLRKILAWHKHAEADYKGLGARPIDASLTKAEVTRKIISLVGEE